VGGLTELTTWVGGFTEFGVLGSVIAAPLSLMGSGEF
jgi:hypothetical protein